MCLLSMCYGPTIMEVHDTFKIWFQSSNNDKSGWESNLATLENCGEVKNTLKQTTYAVGEQQEFPEDSSTLSLQGLCPRVAPRTIFPSDTSKVGSLTALRTLLKGLHMGASRTTSLHTCPPALHFCAHH